MRKNILKITLLAVMIVIAVITLVSWKSSSKEACEESMEQCCKKKNPGSDASIWESGGQFFSTSSLN